MVEKSLVVDGLVVVKELWNLCPEVKVGIWDLCWELIGLPACLNEKDVEQQRFEGRQFAAVKTLGFVVSKLFVVVQCVWWGSVGVQHWVFGDVLDVKLECGRVDVRSDVEKGNVGDVVKGFEVVGSEIFDGVSDVVNVAKSEIEICVDVEDVEGEWSAVGIWNDENADKKPVDVVDPKVEVQMLCPIDSVRQKRD